MLTIMVLEVRNLHFDSEMMEIWNCIERELILLNVEMDGSQK
jgi:hypothetical protein